MQMKKLRGSESCASTEDNIILNWKHLKDKNFTFSLAQDINSFTFHVIYNKLH